MRNGSYSQLNSSAEDLSTDSTQLSEDPPSAERDRKKNNLKPVLFSAIILIFLVGIVIFFGWVIFNKVEPEKDEQYGYWFPTENETLVRETEPIEARPSSPANDTKLNALVEILRRNLNLSVDPCHDFFQYSCGKLLDNSEIPPDKAIVSSLSLMAEKVDDWMAELLTSPISTNSIAIEKLKIIHQKCLKKADYEDIAMAQTRRKIQKLGYWLPLFDTNNTNLEEVADFSKILLYLAEGSYEPTIFKLHLDFDLKNHSRRIVLFGEPDVINYPMWKSPKKYQTFINESLNSEINKLTLIAKELNLSMKEDFVDEIKAMHQFNLDLVEAMLPDSERLAPWANYSLENFANFSRRFENRTGLDLRRFLSAHMTEEIRQFIYDNQTLVYQKEFGYAERLFDLLDQTPLKTLLNHLMIGRAYSYLGFFPSRFENTTARLNQILSGTTARQSQRDRCLQFSKLFQTAYAALFIRNHFSDETKDSISQMVTTIREAFSKIVGNVDWIDEKTKLEAQRKILEIGAHVGYREEERNATQLEEVYAELDIRKEMNFIEIIDEYLRWKTERLYRAQAKPFKKDFTYDTSSVNAAYLASQNRISMPAGILQSPFYDKDYLMAWNYGAIGSIIGHEVTHGFDILGRHYDGAGYLRDWWSAETIDKFYMKTTCFRKQYGSQELEGFKVNGLRTLAENIADNGGVRQSFAAYMHYLAENGGQEERLPAPFDQLKEEQLFFIGYAQFWCQKQRRESLAGQILDDAHSPSILRVNIVLGNQPEFQSAFNCPAGSPMVLEKRCAVW